MKINAEPSDAVAVTSCMRARHRDRFTSRNGSKRGNGNGGSSLGIPSKYEEIFIGIPSQVLTLLMRRCLDPLRGLLRGLIGRVPSHMRIQGRC